MKTGMDLHSALREAMVDLRALDDPYVDHIAVIAVDRDGEHAGYSYRPDERYVYMTESMSEPDEAGMAPP